jgi:hypothetical protein
MSFRNFEDTSSFLPQGACELFGLARPLRIQSQHWDLMSTNFMHRNQEDEDCQSFTFSHSDPEFSWGASQRLL